MRSIEPHRCAPASQRAGQHRTAQAAGGRAAYATVDADRPREEPAAARGRSNKEIAQPLGIAAKTVGHHVSHIYTKIGVLTRAAAALFAVDHDLLGR
jgi:DNA-binding NarL/FixJ family response regulator